jgi:hypothetical protein
LSYLNECFPALNTSSNIYTQNQITWLISLVICTHKFAFIQLSLCKNNCCLWGKICLSLHHRCRYSIILKKGNYPNFYVFIKDYQIVLNCLRNFLIAIQHFIFNFINLANNLIKITAIHSLLLLQSLSSLYLKFLSEILF